MNIIPSIKQILQSRTALIQFGIIMLLTVAVLIVVAIYVRPNELQVVNRYSAYGIQQFFRDQWWQQLSFGLFAVISAVAYVFLYVKLNDRKGIEFAKGFGWIMITMFTVWLITIIALLRVVSL